MRNEWTVLISSSREPAATVSRCLDSVIQAISRRTCSIDLLVNGNLETARKAGDYVRSMDLNPNISIRVWHIPLADKANAWNWYLHQIWPGGDLAIFVDGYVRVAPDSFLLIEKALAEHQESLTVSGVPAVGRSASYLRRQSLRTGSGIHGNLFGMRGTTWAAQKARGFRLPLGLYRTDALMGAFLCFALDPAHNSWNFRCIHNDPSVTWAFDTLKWWRPKDIYAQLKRAMRQAQGRLENRAIHDHLAVRRQPAEELAHDASALVKEWVEACPSEARHLFLRHPTCLLAYRKLRKRHNWSVAAEAPELVFGTTMLVA